MKPFPLWSLFRTPQPPSPELAKGLVYCQLDDADALQLSRRLLSKSQVAPSLMVRIGPHLSLDGAKQFAKAIGNSNLTSLVLTTAKRGNDDNTLQYMYQGIQRSETLKHLKICLGRESHNHALDLSQLPTSLQSLRLFLSDGGCGTSIRTLQTLIQGLTCTTSLNSLELGNLNLGNADDTQVIELMSYGLSENSSLTSLSLQGNMRDAHVAYLMEHGWCSNAPLQHLSLDSIYLTIVGLQKILQSTLNHPSLQSLQSLTLNLMFSGRHELFDAIRMMGSYLPQLCLRQLRVDLSLCGESVDQPLPEKVQNDTFYDLIRQVQNNQYLSQIRVSGWSLQQPQKPMFELRFGI